MPDMKELAANLKELEEQLKACIRCGMCQSVCPLYRQTRREEDVARGKLALLEGLSNNLFEDPDGVYERLNRCLLCGSCAANCPSGVNALEIFIRARSIIAGFKGMPPLKKIIFRGMLANPAVFDKLAYWAGRFQPILSKPENNLHYTSSPRIISPLLGDRNFPVISKEPFNNSAFSLSTETGRSGFKVAFFTGCLIDKVFPRIVDDLVDVFDHHGIGLSIPGGQGCCGIPALSSGDIMSFNSLVEHSIGLFNPDRFDYLVTACATCTSTIKKLWPSVYKGKSSGVSNRLRRLCAKTMDVNQFLTRIIGLEAFSRTDDSLRVTYHDPCHLKKSMDISDEPREVIRASGSLIVEMVDSDNCCGMGGSFSLFHYKLSSEIGSAKLKNIEATCCDTVATGCPACMIQISDMMAKQGLNIPVRHPIELYAHALRKKRQAK